MLHEGAETSKWRRRKKRLCPDKQGASKRTQGLDAGNDGPSTSLSGGGEIEHGDIHMCSGDDSEGEEEGTFRYHLSLEENAILALPFLSELDTAFQTPAANALDHNKSLWDERTPWPMPSFPHAVHVSSTDQMDA